MQGSRRSGSHTRPCSLRLWRMRPTMEVDTSQPSLRANTTSLSLPQWYFCRKWRTAWANSWLQVGSRTLWGRRLRSSSPFGPSRLYRRSQAWKVDRLWLKWRQVRLALRPCSSYHRITLSLWRALHDRLASAWAEATAPGSSLATAVAPGRMAPYICMGTPYLPRLMTHYGVRHVSGRVQASGDGREWVPAARAGNAEGPPRTTLAPLQKSGLIKMSGRGSPYIHRRQELRRLNPRLLVLG